MNFIVVGTSGYEEWTVGRPRSSEYLVSTHAELANRWAQQHGCAHSRPTNLPENPFDPRMRVFHTGVEYSYVGVFDLYPH